jgi:hypothetical protein
MVDWSAEQFQRQIIIEDRAFSHVLEVEFAIGRDIGLWVCRQPLTKPRINRLVRGVDRHMAISVAARA